MSDSEGPDSLSAQREIARRWFENRDLDYETAYGKASAKKKPPGKLGLLNEYYDPDEFSQSFCEDQIELIDFKIKKLSNRVSDEHLDTLRRRREALTQIRDSPVTEYEHEHLTWGNIESLAFEDNHL